MNKPSAAYTPRFFNCAECGKLHAAAGISPMTKCPCGRYLWSVLYPAAAPPWNREH